MKRIDFCSSKMLQPTLMLPVPSEWRELLMPGYLNKLSNYFIKILHFQKPKIKKIVYSTTKNN